MHSDIHDVLAMFPLVFPTKDVILRALDLHSRYSLSHWDSMVVAACIEAVRPLAPMEECCSEEAIRVRKPRILITNYR